MKCFTCLMILFAFFVAAGTATADEGLLLTKDGKSDYVISIPASPKAVERTAAVELQKHIAMVTGAELKIISEDKVPPDTAQIVIGPSKRMKELLPKIDVNSLGPDGIVMKTVGKNIVLAGRPPRGTLYAVYTFLEDVVGCRWWTSTESQMPKKTDAKGTGVGYRIRTAVAVSSAVLS